VLDLENIYRETLLRCSPSVLIPRALRPDMPRNLVGIGKCAGLMADAIDGIDGGIVVVPKGYPISKKLRTIEGGHPQMDSDSFRAGREVMRFVDAHRSITFLISGGGSACVEVALDPFDDGDVADVNRRLVAAGLPIREINIARKHLSAIKGGRLAARVRERSVSLILSDVSSGDLASVASGPTLPDTSTRDEAIAILEQIGCDRIVASLRNVDAPLPVRQISNTEALLIADNTTLTSTAASVVEEQGWTAVRWEGQIENSVEESARDLGRRAAGLRAKEVLVAGGEPTAIVSGNGRGGRCSELLVRFAMAAGAGFTVLFGSSDGVDGSSGAAGFVATIPASLDRDAITAALARSDSASPASEIGRPIIMPPSGNNLRDLYLVARG
jgi:glycerate 2-kinase